MNINWKSKALWLNVIAIVVMILQYLLNLPTNPATWVAWEGLGVVVLNAISGMIQSGNFNNAKAQLKACGTPYRNKFNQPK